MKYIPWNLVVWFNLLFGRVWQSIEHLASQRLPCWYYQGSVLSHEHLVCEIHLWQIGAGKHRPCLRSFSVLAAFISAMSKQSRTRHCLESLRSIDASQTVLSLKWMWSYSWKILCNAICFSVSKVIILRSANLRVTPYSPDPAWSTYQRLIAMLRCCKLCCTCCTDFSGNHWTSFKFDIKAYHTNLQHWEYSLKLVM